MHTGEASPSDGRYVGLAVHRAARISAAGHGGQVLMSGSTRDVVEDDLPPEQHLRDLGEQRLKDLPRPERVFQLLAAGLDSDFPPLKTLDELAMPWWRRARVLAPVAGVVAAVVVAGALLVGGSDEAGAAGVSANALGLIDPGSGNLEGEISVDAAPTGVASGDGCRLGDATRTTRPSLGSIPLDAASARRSTSARAPAGSLSEQARSG